MTTIKPALEVVAARRGRRRGPRSCSARPAPCARATSCSRAAATATRYLEKFAVLSDPAATSELCGFWAAAYRRDDGTPNVDLVAGPTTGGVILAFETGRQLGVRAIFAEEVTDADGATTARVPARLPDRAAASGSSSSTTSSRPAARCSRCCPRSRRWAARSSNAPSSSTGAAAGRRSPRRRPAASTRSARSGSSTCRRTRPAPRRARCAPPARRSTRPGAPAPRRNA